MTTTLSLLLLVVAHGILVLWATSQLVVLLGGAARSSGEYTAGTGGLLYVAGLLLGALVPGDGGALLQTVGLALCAVPLVWTFWPAFLADLRQAGSWRALLRLEIRAVLRSLRSSLRSRKEG